MIYNKIFTKLALALLILNGRSKWGNRQHQNSRFTSLFLVVTLALFLLAGWFTIQS